jgi:hypothetical protein
MTVHHGIKTLPGVVGVERPPEEAGRFPLPLVKGGDLSESGTGVVEREVEGSSQLRDGEDRLRVLEDNRWNDFFFSPDFDDPAADISASNVWPFFSPDGIGSRMNSGSERSVSGWLSRSLRSIAS